MMMDDGVGDLIVKRKKRHLVYNPVCDHSTFDFVNGMLFENETQFTYCVQKYDISIRYNIS